MRLKKEPGVFNIPAAVVSIQNDTQTILYFNNWAKKIINNIELGKTVGEVFPQSAAEWILSDQENGKKCFSIFNNSLDISKIVLSNKEPVTLIFLLESNYFQRKENEYNELKRLNAELNETIESVNDGIYVTDGKGKTLRINKAYTEITGLKEDEVIGKDVGDLVKQGVFFESSSLMAVEKRCPVTLVQTIRSKKKILITSNPIFNENNQVVRIVTSVRDVTTLFRLQTELDETKKLNELYKNQIQKIKQDVELERKVLSKNAKMKNILNTIIKIVNADCTVLLLGETGVGKEMMANIIHKHSNRSKNNFVSINCNSIPENLFEAELFGYEPGAFTGAKASGKKGMFEIANNGTLFLDEVGDLPLMLQGKILRALQEKEIMKIGGEKKIKINVRIVAATNKNLRVLVEKGEFREDLFYRLNVIPICVLPLRERKEDIYDLAYRFVDEFNNKYNLNKTISSDVLNTFMNYSWPGNIRELKNLIEQLVLLSNNCEITLSDLPKKLSEAAKTEKMLRTNSISLKHAMREYELTLINETIKECGSIRKAAKKLGVHYSTIAKKISSVEHLH